MQSNNNNNNKKLGEISYKISIIFVFFFKNIIVCRRIQELLLQGEPKIDHTTETVLQTLASFFFSATL